MAENVKVIVRCRPMNEKERNMKCKVCRIQLNVLGTSTQFLLELFVLISIRLEYRKSE